ncbi:TPA: tyrosine-type recombinase/integrase [Enterobacter asburiae]
MKNIYLLKWIFEKVEFLGYFIVEGCYPNFYVARRIFAAKTEQAMTAEDNDRPVAGALQLTVAAGHAISHADDKASLNPASAYLISLNSPRSRQTMGSFLRIVANLLGASGIEKCAWGSLRRHHVMAITELLRDSGRSAATVNTYLSALKGVAREAWMLKLMDVESFQHIHAIKNLRGSRLPRGRALSKSEIRRLFLVCEADKSCIGPRDAALLAVILGCGLRRSEAVGLDMSDIVTTDRALRVLGKGNKERLAYMPAGTWQRLQKWIDDARGGSPGPIFTRIRRFDTLTTDRLTDQAVYHILQVRQKLAGIDKCSPHDLRRTFATVMLQNGEDLITVKDAMGHVSIATTQQYDRRGEQRLRAARDKLNLTD